MNKAMEAKEGKFRGRKGRLKTELCRLLTNEAGREKEVKIGRASCRERVCRMV